MTQVRLTLDVADALSVGLSLLSLARAGRVPCEETAAVYARVGEQLASAARLATHGMSRPLAEPRFEAFMEALFRLPAAYDVITGVSVSMRPDGSRGLVIHTRTSDGARMLALAAGVTAETKCFEGKHWVAADRYWSDGEGPAAFRTLSINGPHENLPAGPAELDVEEFSAALDLAEAACGEAAGAPT